MGGSGRSSWFEKNNFNLHLELMWFWFVGVLVFRVFSPEIGYLTVLLLCGGDGKGEVNLCCIFLHSSKTENKWERLYIFSAGFSGFIIFILD